ncbi:MAG: hypothetical protein WCD57_22965 [Acidobacteriaceae bacterium]
MTGTLLFADLESPLEPWRSGLRHEPGSCRTPAAAAMKLEPFTNHFDVTGIC